MNQIDPTEDRINTWLQEEASGELPDWVLGATFERTRHEPQRSSAWGRFRIRLQEMGRRPGRRPTMFLATRAAAVVVLIALGTGVAFTLRPVSTTGPGTHVVAESPSPSPSMVPQEAVYVTGTYRANSSVDGAQSPLPHGGTAVRGDRYVGAVTMSDPRLSGEVTLEYDADVYPQPEASETAYIGWGTIEVANDDGRWVGRSVTTDVDAAGHSMVIYEVTGEGAYAGYSAVFFEQEPSLGTFSWTGVIFPGELPPDR